MSSLPTISIDALSEQAGVDVETIRAYERLGLLGKPREHNLASDTIAEPVPPTESRW